MIRMAELREMKMEETGESVDRVERCIFLIEERSWVGAENSGCCPAFRFDSYSASRVVIRFGSFFLSIIPGVH
jgi:hypothetical protein